MSLLEWFFESTNPGPVGKIGIISPDPNHDGRKPPKKWLIYIAATLGLCLMCVTLYWAYNNLLQEGTKPTVTKLGYFCLYIVVGYFVRPAPDTTNIGWMGGLLNNPFRISDNFNRALLLIQVVFVPGRLMGYCILMCWLTGWYFKKKA